MADGNINVSCPGCGAVFELPPEMGGEMGECTECGTIFEIPRLEVISEGKLEKTDTGAVKVAKAPEGATNTVKLSRASIGMVPDVKDNFKFGPVSATGTHQTITSASATKRFKNSPVAAASSTSRTRVQDVMAASKPWWSFLLFWK